MANELIEFVLVSVALLGIGIYGLSVKRNAIRMLFAVEIIVNAANLNLIAFARFMPEAVSYTHLRAHETGRNLVCRLLLEKKKKS